MKNAPTPDVRRRSEREYYDAHWAGEPAFKRPSCYDWFTDQMDDWALTRMQELRGRTVLFLGCGINNSLIKTLSDRGARVIAIDISLESVRQVRCEIERKRIPRAYVFEADGQVLGLADQSVDIVFGQSVIHHLDVPKACLEIYRVLKPGGKALFIEPMGTNPLINLYRRLTPAGRTPYERPLRSEDIVAMQEIFDRFASRCFYLTSLVTIPLSRWLREESLRRWYRRLNRVDDFLFQHVPYLERFCWDVVLELEKRPVVRKEYYEPLSA